jgi:hypothetical protein
MQHCVVADCGIMARNYSAAASDYNLVLNKKLPESDYALYQKSII